MDDDLREQLTILLKDYLRDNLDNWHQPKDKVEEYLRVQMPGYTTNAIRQAFLDAGWTPPPPPGSW
jgi:hypothetical protein